MNNRNIITKKKEWNKKIPKVHFNPSSPLDSVLNISKEFGFFKILYIKYIIKKDAIIKKANPMIFFVIVFLIFIDSECVPQ